MCIVVVGGIGWIGGLVVMELMCCGYEVVLLSCGVGIDFFIGVGFCQCFEGVDVVIDVINFFVVDIVEVEYVFVMIICNFFIVEMEMGVCYYVVLLIVVFDVVVGNFYYYGK